MAKLHVLLAVIASLLMIAVITPPPSASAQSIPFVEPAIIHAADAVVEATVTTSHALEIDGTPHTAFELSVTDTLKGTVASTAYVVVVGGTFADGRQLFVSHNPQFEVGDEIQAALVAAAPTLTASLTAAVGADSSAVFEVAGGHDGVFTVNSPLGSAEFAGARDYVLDGLTWASFDPAVEFYVNPSGSTMDQAATIAAAREAAQDWEDDRGSLIDLAYGGTTTATGPDLSDGINSVSFRRINNQGSLATAYWISNGSGGFHEFDIVVNTRYRFTNGSGAGTWFDLPTTLRHEFGHVLGLAHVGASSEVMSEHVQQNTVKPLGAGDIAGLRALYPDRSARYCGGQIATVNLTKGQQPTNGDDVIVGTPGNDTINGLGGNDIICGLGGNDTISGGEGDDTIKGGGGADTLNGDSGRDTLQGNDGNDTINGGTQGDKIYGGEGDDTLLGDGGWDWIYGDQGADVMRGGYGSDKMFGGTGADQIFGNTGPDKIEGGAGADVIEAGKGQDTVLGGDGTDTISGGGGPDTLSGGNGADTLNGNKGSDVLNGDGSTDKLFGGGGWDTLNGGPANDFCNGGFGQDIARTCETTISTP